VIAINRLFNPVDVKASRSASSIRSTVVGCPLNVRKVAEALGMKTEPSRTEYDVVIVGGGPAGLASAICGSSEGLDVLLVERSGIGGQAASSSRIENYPGFPSGISGNELGSKALKQATHFGADIVVTREVRNVVCLPEEYCVEIDGGCQIQTRCIVLTTGVQWRKLEATGVERLTGKGVLYGAARTEAHSVLGKKIFIVGGGNSAGQAAMFFSGYASSVTMLVRGKDITHSMSQYLVEQLKRRANIFVDTGSEVISAHGEAHLESICTLSNGETRSRQADALFVMIGASADSSWMPKELMRDQHGFIFTGRDLTTKPGHRTPYALETNLPGVFCAGDVRHGSIKRVSRDGRR
jgi:thioredoxin reductase (NADPH)